MPHYPLTIDFTDASFDNDSITNPVAPDNVDVVFPIVNDEVTIGSGTFEKTGVEFNDTRATLGTTAQSIALTPTGSTEDLMEEFLFEFDNDMNDDTTTGDTGLRVSMAGSKTGSGGEQQVKSVVIDGPIDDLTGDGTLDVTVPDDYVDLNNNNQRDANEAIVYKKIQLGIDSTNNSGNDTAMFVSGDTDGGNMGSGNDTAMINVDASATMSGMYQGGSGYDILQLVEGVAQDNGALVDFERGFNANEAEVFNYGGTGGIKFDFKGFEEIQLTDNADVLRVAASTGGSNLTNVYDTAYMNPGSFSNSMINVMTGFTDGGLADTIYVDTDSDLYLSFEFSKEIGVNATFSDDGNVDIVNMAYESGSGPVIDVDVVASNAAGESNRTAIDFFEATSSKDIITNNNDIGVTVDLGGSGTNKANADIFTGSSTSSNDVLDAREAYDLEFSAGNTAEYIHVKGDNENGQTVNADLKSVDYIMVRDRQQGPEITQADVADYDAETDRLSKLVQDAQTAINNFDNEVDRLEGLESDASDAVTKYTTGVTTGSTRSDLLQAISTADGNRVTDPGSEVTAGQIQAFDDLVAEFNAASDPRNLVVTGTVGNSGVTDANGDGIVDLNDIQAYMNARLTTRALEYFAQSDVAVGPQQLIDSTPSEKAAYRTAMTSVDGEGNGADDQPGAITTPQGFDQFILDLPQLVSSQDINEYDTLKNAYDNRVDPGDQVVTTAMIQNYQNLEQAYSDANTALSNFDTEVQRLEGVETSASKAVNDFISGVTNGGVTRANLVTDKGVADGNLKTHTDVPRPVLTDVDFYADNSHLIGSQIVDSLGGGATDDFGLGYDVITSAQVDSFSTYSDLRVYYEGDHGDFTDTDDVVTSVEGSFVMSAGDSGRGSAWEGQIDALYAPGMDPGFYIEVGATGYEKKLAVTFDEVKGAWKVDTTAIQVAEGASSAISGISSAATPEGEPLANAISEQFGIALKPTADHTQTFISNDIFLNATEDAVKDLMANGTVSLKASNFDFYTQVKVESADGPVTVNVKLGANDANTAFTLDLTDIDVAVESFHNVVDVTGAGVSSSSEAGEFVKIDNAADIALGNGGDDTYVVGADPSTGIYGGTALEYGNIDTYGGLTGSIDAINFNSVDSVADLEFVRTKTRQEADGNTLEISQANGLGGTTVLFDNYNDFLDFRRVEYLSVEDGANNDEIYEIVTGTYTDGGNIADWDNEIYVSHATETSMDVELGGIDYVIGATGSQDTFNFKLADIISAGNDESVVNLSNISSADGDTLVATDASSYMSDTDKGLLEAALAQGISNGVSQVKFSYDVTADKQLTLKLDDLASVTYDLDLYSV